MKKLTPAIFFIASMAGSVSCKKEVIGEGPVITQVRNISSFTGIDLQMNGNVYYENDADWKVEVTAKESIHPILETRVTGGKLVIRYTNGRTYDEDESIRIHIAGPGINRFELNSSGNIYFLSEIHQPELFLRSSGSGNILLQQADAGIIIAETRVSGHITAIGGSMQTGILKTEGSGKIDFSAVAAKKLNAHIVGSGDIKIKVSEQLDARIDGSGSIYFSGSPFVISDISGTGRMIHF